MYPSVELTYLKGLDNIASGIAVPGHLGLVSTHFLVDSGSTNSLVSMETVHQAGLLHAMVWEENHVLCQEVNEFAPRILGRLAVPLMLGKEGDMIVYPYITVMDKAPCSILGMDILWAYGCILDLSEAPRLTFTMVPTTQPLPMPSAMLSCTLYNPSCCVPTEALLNTGSSCTVIPWDLVVQMGMEDVIEPVDCAAVTITGTAQCLGVIRGMFLLVMGQLIQEDLLVYDKIECPFLGLRTLLKIGYPLQFIPYK